MVEVGTTFYQRLQNTKNAILVKDDVGKPKRCTRDLPSQDFSYGIKPPRDAEGAGAVISSWAVHSPPLIMKKDHDYKRLNILSLKRRCVTPKQVNQFRRQNVVSAMLLKDDNQVREKRYRRNLPSNSFSYGVPTKPSTPITNVVGNYYGNEAQSNLDSFYQPQARYSVRKEFEPYQRRRGESQQSKPRELFKMKKFQKVKAKVYRNRSHDFNLDGGL